MLINMRSIGGMDTQRKEENMLNRIIAVTQGTEEWKDLRKGLPTTSRFSDFITKSLNYSESDTARNYKYQCVAERILNRHMEEIRYDSYWMKHGRKYEAQAAHFLAEKMKKDLLPGGFCKNEVAGCSPDRIVAGKDEIVEIKCPAPWTHCRYLDEGLGEEYEIQVQGQLWITGANACHFWSYWPDHDNIPPVYQVRYPNNIFMRKIAEHVRRFYLEVGQAERRLLENGANPVVESNR